MTLDALLDEVEKLGGRLVELTGGEPLLQEEAYPLMATLADRGWTVLLETSGGVATDRVDPRVRVILDVKTPASGEVEANVWPNLGRLRPTDEVKFVLGDRDDFDWAVEVIRRHGLIERCPVLMSAVFGRVEPTDLAGWILGAGLAIRLQVQLHKILWDPKARGV
jgi:7-carboxy-7-deazaguanine synthase